MLIISTVPEAIGLMLAGILLLGTWPAVWHQVEQYGRLPSHIFMDYCITYLIFATACALTLGQLGPPAFSSLGQSLQFLDQLTQQQNWPMVLFAIGGGTCLALGDLALQYSIALCGLSVGPPILNSITVVMSVVLAYFLDGGINKPELVFTGAAFAAVAVGLGAAAHVVTQKAKAKGSSSSDGADCSAVQQQGVMLEDSAHALTAEQKQLRTGKTTTATTPSGSSSSGGGSKCTCVDHSTGVSDAEMHIDTRQHGNANSSSKDCEVGSLHSLALEVHSSGRQQPLRQQQQQQRSITASRSASLYFGLCLSVVGGMIYGCFMPAFQMAANDPFKLLQSPTPPLSVYTTYFYFAISFTSVSGAINIYLMYRPPLGIKPSSLPAYLRDNRGRALSIFSGILAGAGDLFQFMGGQTAGYAAAMMVMAYPVVGVLWGLFRFKELRHRPGGVTGFRGLPWGLLLVVSQVVMYVLSVGLLSGSAELRAH